MKRQPRCHEAKRTMPLSVLHSQKRDNKSVTEMLSLFNYALCIPTAFNFPFQAVNFQLKNLDLLGLDVTRGDDVLSLEGNYLNFRCYILHIPFLLSLSNFQL